MGVSAKRVTLILGSNMGNREQNISIAISLLVTELASCIFSDVTESSLLESEPWGFEADTPFINQAISFVTSCPAEVLLKVCQYVEQKLGREEHSAEYDASGKRIYHSRIIDIDIVLYGDEKIDLPHLKIPHPQIWERDYAKKLLEELNSNN
ncbi:MAG: 2-amino-4-hydroxy-6-hydroxymethyldihydropteridine diphosphokinase [Bacteroidales bacterium]|jgi:2-amino-4-hydroxy-6-hydroxymethyldihydropteridine diphosphokinase|nr:2-amino-4-hydroxy-6-hydroxymethyldihydropteridine diphosphokinase [Bacteroidales bacterium]